MGGQIVDYARQPGAIAFGDTPALHHVGCIVAEPNLVMNIGKIGIVDGPQRSPIIVTHNHKPVGIVKCLGERTCYGLETIPELGLVRAGFSSPSLRDTANDLPKTDQAWKAPVSAFEEFAPLRYSVFALPADLLAVFRDNTLDPYTRGILEVTHEQIAARAGELLATAKPL